jgi:hypothetical protein
VTAGTTFTTRIYTNPNIRNAPKNKPQEMQNHNLNFGCSWTRGFEVGVSGGMAPGGNWLAMLRVLRVLGVFSTVFGGPYYIGISLREVTSARCICANCLQLIITVRREYIYH